MILVKKTADLIATLSPYRTENKSIGFVPTMGALHEGHISLVEQCIGENDVCVSSIFINPTQFNNKSDLAKYPVTIEADIDMLEKAGCTVLFLPSVAEMYPEGETAALYDLGMIGTILEGEYRPGHFQGVSMIVDKLLAAVMPQTMYLGQKDYQQCMVIRKMMLLKGYRTALRICDTMREPGGLAMSSRNMRLNEEERKNAVRIFEALNMIRKEMATGDLSLVKKKAVSFLEGYGFKPDYVEIADADTLELQNYWDGKMKLVVVAAAYLNDVRLIDNIVL